MSTVLPDALPDELPAAAVLLLPLLLQPAAASATAARAATAWIRLIIFLSLIPMVRLPRSTVTVRPGFTAARQPGDEQPGHVLCGGRACRGADSARSLAVDLPGSCSLAGT